jgi:homoserine O-succinyltransferase
MAYQNPLASDRRGRFASIEIALVNIAPDDMLKATERQFTSLIEAAADGASEVRLGLYTLAGLPHGHIAQAALAERYRDLDALKQANVDALIVSDLRANGPNLSAEPWWAGFTELVDWARGHTASAIFSAGAAQAAVLHLDGLRAKTLPGQCAGVFSFARMHSDGLAEGLPNLLRAPHLQGARLDAAELEAKGYRILTRSPRAGVDTFIRPGQSLCVFLEGHPEHEPDSLLRDYCREVGRYLHGERTEYPQSPHGYFDPVTERSFRALAMRARTSPEARLLGWCSEIAGAMRPARPWRDHSVALFRNWLRLVAGARAGAPGWRASA